jgi:hypothetical protein
LLIALGKPKNRRLETQPPKLLDQVRIAIRTRHYSIRTEASYVDWVRRYILFHQKKHPKDMGAAEIQAFLLQQARTRAAVKFTLHPNAGNADSGTARHHAHCRHDPSPQTHRQPRARWYLLVNANVDSRISDLETPLGVAQ